MNAEYIKSPPTLKRQNAFCLKPGQIYNTKNSTKNSTNNISSEIFNLQQNQFEDEIDFAEILHRGIDNNDNYDNDNNY